MKHIILLALFSLSTLAVARSGIQSGTYSVYGDTEDQAIAKAETILPDLIKLKIKEVVLKGREGQCQFKTGVINNEYNFKVVGITLDKLYKIKDNEKILPYYRARMEYRFGRCRERGRD